MSVYLDQFLEELNNKKMDPNKPKDHQDIDDLETDEEGNYVS
jgi:hypothetical protein